MNLHKYVLLQFSITTYTKILLCIISAIHCRILYLLEASAGEPLRANCPAHKAPSLRRNQRTILTAFSALDFTKPEQAMQGQLATQIREISISEQILTHLGAWGFCLFTFARFGILGWIRSDIDIINPFANYDFHFCFYSTVVQESVSLYVYVLTSLLAILDTNYNQITHMFIWIGNSNPCLWLNRRP